MCQILEDSLYDQESLQCLAASLCRQVRRCVSQVVRATTAEEEIDVEEDTVRSYYKRMCLNIVWTWEQMCSTFYGLK